jgi:endonuclease/exonuclease/phosphatase (EEP) superfamily protein YafD
VVHSPKVTLITSYPIANTDKLLTVVNLHAINFVSSKSFRIEMQRIYDAIKNIPSPLVFAGDFNTWNNDRIVILDEFSKKLGLSEAKFSPDNRMRFNGFPLDHFLYTKDIKITNARVDEFYQGSDHKPLQVEIEYLNPSITQDEVDQNSQE